MSEDIRKVIWLELFYDFVFVVAIAKVLRGLLIFIYFLRTQGYGKYSVARYRSHKIIY